VACVRSHGAVVGAGHEKMVHPRLLSGMNDSMEWSHASLDHVRRCSSRKRAVAGSPASQPSVNSEPSVVQDDPQGSLTNASGNILRSYGYDAYGKVSNSLIP
jgi:hypothetical protein